MSKKLHLSPRSRVFRAIASGAALAAMSALTGCALLFDYSDLTQASEDEGSQGGQGGTGGNNAEPCKPGAQRTCYEGPIETMMVGACTQGTQTCKGDGSGFGPCEGQVLPQVEDCATPKDESCDGLLDDGPPVCSASVVWAKQLTGTGNQVPLAAAVDSTGNAIIAGYFEDAAEVGGKPLQSAGMADAFVAKFDSDGVNVFSVSFSGPEHQEARAVATDGGGNTIVVGSFSQSIHFGGGDPIVVSAGMSDIYVAKLNPSGNVLWRHSFGDVKDQQVTSVATDELGNIFVAGRFEGTLDFSGASPLVSAGSTDAFLVKLNLEGAHVWSQRFGDGLAQGAESVAVNKDGEVLLAGWFEGSMDLGKGEQSASGTDGFVAKFTPLGELTWSATIGGVGESRAMAVASDMVGGVIATGYFNGLVDFDNTGPMPGAGQADMFVVKYLGSGQHLWHVKLASVENDRGVSVATDTESNILVSGFLGGSPDLSGFSVATAGGADAFLGKLDPNGEPIWLKTAGDGADEAGTGVAVDPGDDVVWTGHFDSKIRLGNNEFASGDVTDGFVAKVLN